MAFDFPSSPAVGQVFGNYIWDGEKWRLQGGQALGAVRYDTVQILTVGQQTQARDNIRVQKKNYIINGAMMVSQENGATVGTTDGYHPVDLFRMSFGNAGAQVTGQVAGVTPGGSPNRIIVGCNGADASVGATDNLQIIHIVEGLRAADLMFGTAGAKTITVQFGVKAPAGTYCFTVANSGNTRNYVSEYVISAGEANTDVMRSITVPGDVTGTWLKDNSIGIVLHWVLMCGTTYQQAAGSWGTVTSGMATANQFNLMGTAGNNFYLFDVSLTEGTVAPPFAVPDYASELAACKRYWQPLTLFYNVYSTAGGSADTTIPLPVGMRAPPTFTLNAAPGYANCSGATLVAAQQTSIIFRYIITAQGTGLINAACTLNARL